MNDKISLTARRIIANADKAKADIERALIALHSIVDMANINDLLDPLDRIDTAIRAMPEYDEDMTCDLQTLRGLLEEEIADPHCSTCGLTDTVATEGGQGEERGCRCDPQAEEDALDRFRDREEADMIEYQKTER